MSEIVAGLAALVAAGLALGGSFGPVHEVDIGSDGYSITWWGARSAAAQDAESLAGLALVLAALLLGVGAVLAFSRQTAGGRLLLALGLGTLTGTVLLQALDMLQDLSTFNGTPLDAGERANFTTGWGLWLPAGGILVGVVAVVLAHRGPRAGRVEPNTPRMGFPMPYSPGPMTGSQPAVRVGPPAAAPSSTSDEDAEITQRTKVTESPGEAVPSAGQGVATALSTPETAPGVASTSDSAAGSGAPAPATGSAPQQGATGAPGAGPAVPDAGSATPDPAMPEVDSAAPEVDSATPEADSATPEAEPVAHGAESPGESAGAASEPAAPPAADSPAQEAAPPATTSDSGAAGDAPARETDSPTPAAGASLLDLPAAPPAPELDDEQGNSTKK